MELKHTWGNVHPQVLFLLSVLNEVVSCCEVEQVKMQILTDNGHQLHRRVPQTFSLTIVYSFKLKTTDLPQRTSKNLLKHPLW